MEDKMEETQFLPDNRYKYKQGKQNEEKLNWLDASKQPACKRM